MAQNPNPGEGRIFSGSEIAEVHILIHPDSLEQLYLQENWYSNHEYPVTFVWKDSFSSDTLYDIGLRFRGNTARDKQKKSFKVSFNTFEPGRRYHGLKKLNLNSETNDPSMVRSNTSWRTYRDHLLPASRANHVEVYINGAYHGLYQNCEHLNDDWVRSRYGDNAGNLYKCGYPGNLNFISNNPDAYKFTPDWSNTRVYDLKTNEEADDYRDLARFIAFLNQSNANDFACKFQQHFNVYQYLKVLAIDVLTANWDAYLYNQNNYYLYFNPLTARFEYLPYDLDNTWGIDWFGEDWTTRNPYTFSPSWHNLPLYERLMEVQDYRDIFSWHLNDQLNNYINANLENQIVGVHTFITPSALADPFRPLDYGFSSADFLQSLQQAAGGHVDFGVIPYATARKASALGQVEQVNIAPVIWQVQENFGGYPSHIEVHVHTDGPAWSSLSLHYRIDDGEWLSLSANGGDAHTTFTIPLPAGSAKLTYNVTATGTDGLQRDAWCTDRDFFYGGGGVNIVINEAMSSNSSAIADAQGEYDDWIELYNAAGNAVNLTGYYLSDRHNGAKYWPLPSLTMESGSFRLFWADGQMEQGPTHANFSISSSGERLYLFQERPTGLRLADVVDVPALNTDQSWGRQQDGSLPWVDFGTATPGFSNQSAVGTTDTQFLELQPYPNPTRGEVQWQRDEEYHIYDLLGRSMQSGRSTGTSLAHLPKGVYLLKLGHTAHRIVRE